MMRSRLVGWSLTCALGTIGCGPGRAVPSDDAGTSGGTDAEQSAGSSGTPSEPPPPPLSPDDYLEREVEARCALELTCGCDSIYASQSECVADQRDLYERFIEGQLSDGAVFDGTCAARRAEAYEAADCQTEPALPDCDLFENRYLRPGSPCILEDASTEPCQAGTYCKTESTTFPATGVCTAAAEGEDCVLELPACGTGLYCDPIDRVCRPRLSVAEPCIGSSQGTADRALCESGTYCPPDGGICTPLEAEGQPCTTRGQCQGDCIEGMCSAPIC